MTPPTECYVTPGTCMPGGHCQFDAKPIDTPCAKGICAGNATCCTCAWQECKLLLDCMNGCNDGNAPDGYVCPGGTCTGGTCSLSGTFCMPGMTSCTPSECCCVPLGALPVSGGTCFDTAGCPAKGGVCK